MAPAERGSALASCRPLLEALDKLAANIASATRPTQPHRDPNAVPGVASRGAAGSALALDVFKDKKIPNYQAGAHTWTVAADDQGAMARTRLAGGNRSPTRDAAGGPAHRASFDPCLACAVHASTLRAARSPAQGAIPLNVLILGGRQPVLWLRASRPRRRYSAAYALPPLRGAFDAGTAGPHGPIGSRVGPVHLDLGFARARPARAPLRQDDFMLKRCRQAPPHQAACRRCCRLQMRGRCPAKLSSGVIPPPRPGRGALALLRPPPKSRRARGELRARTGLAIPRGERVLTRAESASYRRIHIRPDVSRVSRGQPRSVATGQRPGPYREATPLRQLALEGRPSVSSLNEARVVRPDQRRRTDSRSRTARCRGLLEVEPVRRPQPPWARSRGLEKPLLLGADGNRNQASMNSFCCHPCGTVFTCGQIEDGRYRGACRLKSGSSAATLCSGPRPCSSAT
jgi:hypothetical protein